MTNMATPGDASGGRTETSRGPVIVAAVVVALVLVAYLPSLGGGFFSDDFFYIVGNEKLQNIPLTRSWELFVGRTNPIEFLPVRDLSYRLDMALFGLRPFGYHVHNLLLYAICCAAAWLCCNAILRLLGATSRAWMSSLVTILFAVHPAHVETVAWVSGRKELLSGIFALLALGQFARALLPDRPDRRRLLLSYGLFLLALMSKSAVLPVVAVAALLAVIRYRSPADGWPAAIGRLALALGPMALLAAAWLWLTVAVGSETMVRADPFETEVIRRAGNVGLATRILGHLAKIAVAPIRLRLVYDLTQPGLLGQVAPAVGGLTLLFGALGAVAAWRRASLPGFGAACFVVLCLPFLQLIPFTTWSLASERFLFLPVFGLALASAALLGRLAARWRFGLALALAAAGLAVTLGQSSRWGAREPLIEVSARLAPGSKEVQMLLVNKVLLPAGRYADALEALAGVRDVVSRDVLSRYVRARRALDAGDPDLARREAAGLELFVDGSRPWPSLAVTTSRPPAGTTRPREPVARSRIWTARGHRWRECEPGTPTVSPPCGAPRRASRTTWCSRETWRTSRWSCFCSRRHRRDSAASSGDGPISGSPGTTSASPTHGRAGTSKRRPRSGERSREASRTRRRGTTWASPTRSRAGSTSPRPRSPGRCSSRPVTATPRSTSATFSWRWVAPGRREPPSEPPGGAAAIGSRT
jgi:hypothetical protein